MEKRYTDTFQDTIQIQDDQKLTMELAPLSKGSLFVVVKDNVRTLELNLNALQGSQSKLVLYNQGHQDMTIRISIQVHQDAQMAMGYLDMEAHPVNYTQKVELAQPGASFDLLTGQLGHSDVLKKSDIEIIHTAPHTFGEMRNFAVLFDRAHYEMVANGNIQKGCAESQSHQTTRVLTLGKDHKAQVIPLLLIDENDVKASHAQTIGQPDADQLYYLQSRGLSHRQALGLLSIGYLLPVLDLIDDESVRDTIRHEMESKVGLHGHSQDS